MWLASACTDRAGCKKRLSFFQIYSSTLDCGFKRLKHGTLFVVATPIGNRDDMSQRARQVLTDVDVIAAEDTRHTGRLLSHFGIKSRQIALHDHNEEEVIDDIIVQLKSGKSVALVSDAGTPLISDPGFRLLRAAHEHGVPVSPVPGAAAFVAALSVAGLPIDRICCEGFLPAKGAARRTRLRELAGEPRTTVFYESVHRIADTIDDLLETHDATRHAFVGRELTKLHEQCVKADLQSIATMLADGRIPMKGEFVVAVAGCPDVPDELISIDSAILLRQLVDVLPGKQAVEIVASLSGIKRNELYRRMLAMGDDTDNKD
jgi:16S rRNA (cytidine1402-2'-O)-methyltransferase